MVTYITLLVWILFSTISWKILEMYYYTHCILWGNNMLQCNLDTIDIELGLGVEGFSNIDEEKNMYLMNYTKVSYA
jgi:hypothetical protein